MAQDNSTVAPDTLPKDFNQWDAAPDTLPKDFNFDGPKASPGFDERLRTSMQKGAENVAGSVKGAYQAIKGAPEAYRQVARDPLGALKNDAASAVEGVKNTAKGAVDYGKSVIDDPANLGQAVTQFGIPALAGATIGGGIPAASAEARIAAQQANADPLKLTLLEAAKTAKQNLNLKMANVTGVLDKSASISRTEVYSGLTKHFGADIEAAPMDVSRLIANSQRPAMSSSPGSMTNLPGQVADSGGSMSFGQLENVRQTIGQALSADKGNTALKGAYKEVSGMLDKLAGQQGLADEYAAAKAGIKDFHTNVVPKGGIIDSATKPTAEDYQSIMKPLDTPALKAKVLKLKELGANIDPEDVAQRIKAYKIYDKSGSAIARHSLRPQNMLEFGGGVAGYGIGGSMGHPIIGAELGIQAARGIGNTVRKTPFPNFPEE